MAMVNIKSVQRQRNGIAGRPFYAAIVENPFGKRDGSTQGPFLVISMCSNRDSETPVLAETCVVSVQEIMDGNLVSAYRGDSVELSVLQEIQRIAKEQLDERTRELDAAF
jgi:hypothetical protein